MTVTAPRLTASDTPSQIAQRKAKRASSSAPKSEKPSTLRVKTFPARAAITTRTAITVPTRAIPAAACE